MNTDVRRARAAFLWVGVVIPLVLIAVATTVAAMWLPEIPEPSALHWSGGTPDLYGPGWTLVALLAGLGGVLILGIGAIAWFSHRAPDARTRGGESHASWSARGRLLGSLNLGLAVLLSGITLTVLGAQRGLADASDAPGIGGGVVLAVAMMLVATLLGWLVQPRVEIVRPAKHDAEPMALAPGERALWIGTATIAVAGRIIFAAAVTVVLVLIVILLVTGAGGPSAVVIASGAVVLVLVLFVSTLTFRVRASASGLSVRSLTGWPRVEIPTQDIRSVRSMHLDPFAEFGGWGLRHAVDGRYGVVLRAGDALEVTRSNGRVFVVTVDDAATAASVLAASLPTSERPLS
jgi:hypothetical protein